ncbi:MAG TPA: hypothetical protein VMS96_13170 [Terriglobales bacterium]|nr:hypothetical protein [Terriglobales bacterium]
MRQLLNALAFAAVVIAVFVMESNLPGKVASSPLVARVARAQAVRQKMVQAEMRRVAERVQVQVQQRDPGACKIVRMDQ